MREKTALIVDPEGKDGAIKREEEQKGERRRLGAEYSDVLRRQTNVWVELVCMQMSLLDTSVCICIVMFNKRG